MLPKYLIPLLAALFTLEIIYLNFTMTVFLVCVCAGHLTGLMFLVSTQILGTAFIKKCF